MEKQFQEHYGEISLYDLWEMIAKRKKLIIGLFLIMVTTTAVVSFLSPKVYRGDVVLKIPTFEFASSNISARELIDLIGKLDREKKARFLPNTHQLITNITLDVLKDSKDKVLVVMEAKDVNAFAPAVSDLVASINSIKLVKTAIRDEQDRYLKRSNELSSVIDASSGLLTTYSKLLKEGRLLPVGFNPVELNKRIADIKIEKLMADQIVEQLKGGVDIARSLYVGHKPVKPDITRNVVLGGVAGLFLGVIYALFMEYIKKIKNVSKGN